MANAAAEFALRQRLGMPQCESEVELWKFKVRPMQDQQEQLSNAAPALKEAPSLVPSEPQHLPVPVKRNGKKRSWRIATALLLLLLGAAGGGGYSVWKRMHPPLPAGISYGNGRIEADEVDIDTKYAGRVAELMADIGDMVTPGQVVARMDTRDIEQSLSKSEAQARQAQKAVDEAQANLTQQRAQRTLAQQEMDRTSPLLKNGWTTQEIADQRKQALDGAIAAYNAANARVLAVQHALDAAQHDADFYKVQIADNTLVAPKAGRIQ